MCEIVRREEKKKGRGNRMQEKSRVKKEERGEGEGYAK